MSRPRTIRVEDDDLDLADRIKAARPSFHHDHDIFRVALVRGLRLLAAEATVPGPNQYGGLDPAQLASELRQLLLPSFELLVAENALPAMLRSAGLAAVGAVSADSPASTDMPTLTAEEVQAQEYERNTSDLRSLLSSLDDDDD